MRRALEQTATFLEMIKFQHSVFALPFALTGMALATGGLPGWWKVGWIIAACVTARTCAMSFNRWADARLDGRNPRTAGRAIPSGKLPRGVALAVAGVSAALFIVCAAMLNTLALALSPVALLVLLGYSYTKRFTSLSHFVLGLALGIAPIGAWIAVRGDLGWIPLMLGLSVMLWTAGFDLIYACQDVDVDVRERLYSVPARMGVGVALRLSGLLHVSVVLLLAGTGLLAGRHWLYYVGVGVTALLLAVEHAIVNPRDLSRIDVAFFTLNSWVGVVIFVFTAADIFVHRAHPV